MPIPKECSQKGTHIMTFMYTSGIRAGMKIDACISVRMCPGRILAIAKSHCEALKATVETNFRGKFS